METIVLVSSFAAGIASALSAIIAIIHHNHDKANGARRITITSEDGLNNTYVLSDQELKRLLGSVDNQLCVRVDGPTGEVAVTKR